MGEGDREKGRERMEKKEARNPGPHISMNCNFSSLVGTEITKARK